MRMRKARKKMRARKARKKCSQVGSKGTKARKST